MTGDKVGRRLTNTFLVDVEVRFDVGQLDVPEEKLRQLADEEGAKVWSRILALIKKYYPHVSVKIRGGKEK